MLRLYSRSRRQQYVRGGWDNGVRVCPGRQRILVDGKVGVREQHKYHLLERRSGSRGAHDSRDGDTRRLLDREAERASRDRRERHRSQPALLSDL
jgi:hypothetical protein